jgi:hypothetical protein
MGRWNPATTSLLPIQVNCPSHLQLKMLRDFPFFWGECEAKGSSVACGTLMPCAKCCVRVALVSPPVVIEKRRRIMCVGSAGVISVSSSDDKDRPTVFARLDTGNTSCIDFFAPGGGLGSPIAGASPAANDTYTYVALVLSATLPLLHIGQALCSQPRMLLLLMLRGCGGHLHLHIAPDDP